jgi:hypothetical protein
MTQAVCFQCGDLKWGAFSHCRGCGAFPNTDDEFIVSLAFTDHHFDPEKLRQIGLSIKQGQSPRLDDETRKRFLPAVHEAKRMFGADRLGMRRAKPHVDLNEAQLENAKVQAKRLNTTFSPNLWLVRAVVVITMVLQAPIILRQHQQSLPMKLLIGLFTGLVFIKLAQLIGKLGKRLTARAPIAAHRAGIIAYWLGVGIALFSYILAGYVALDEGSLVWMGSSAALLYWLAGWGLRRALTPTA